MTKIQKALALIATFQTGDAKQAYDLLASSYIQHNPSYATGRSAFVDSVKALAKAPAPTTVENIRAFEDGDNVFLHTVYDFAAPASKSPLTCSALTKTERSPNTGT